MTKLLKLLHSLRMWFEVYNSHRDACNGLCDAIRQMNAENKIDIGDRNLLLTFLAENRPGINKHILHYCSLQHGRMYWWTNDKNGYRDRLAFLDYLIKLRQNYETITKPI